VPRRRRTTWLSKCPNSAALGEIISRCQRLGYSRKSQKAKWLGNESAGKKLYVIQKLISIQKYIPSLEKVPPVRGIGLKRGLGNYRYKK